MGGLNVLTYPDRLPHACARDGGKPLSGPQTCTVPAWLRLTEDIRAWSETDPHPDNRTATATATALPRHRSRCPPFGMPNHETSEYLPPGKVEHAW